MLGVDWAGMVDARYGVPIARHYACGEIMLADDARRGAILLALGLGVC